MTICSGGQSRSFGCISSDHREGAGTDVDLSRRVSRLTSGQKICLGMVAEHLSSKEIAQRLGISSHTVDQRIRQALRTLGATHRKDAALLLARHEAARRRWLAPWARNSTGRNELTIRWRLIWIILIACGSALASGLILAAAESARAMLRG
jgi:DNA-binding CsgD family transcriptional regulator